MTAVYPLIVYLQIVLLLHNFKDISGSGISHPPLKVASACPGEELTLTCISNVSNILQWTFTGPTATVSHQRYITYDGQSQLQPLHFQAASNSTAEYVYNITRVSESNTLPLISELAINSIGPDLNESEVNCTAINESETMLLAAVIHVHTCCVYPSPPEVTVRANFGVPNVTVPLKWTQEGNASYNVTTVPQVDFMYIGNTSIELSVPYNELYLVSVVATLCVQNSVATDIRLNFSTCGYPLHQHDDDTVVAVDYTSPVIPGTNVTYVCHSELVMTGPSTSMCMENGEWEPDPREVECKANCGAPSPPQNGFIYPYMDTLKGAKVTFTCLNNNRLPHDQLQLENISIAVCNKEGYWEPDPRDTCLITAKVCHDTVIIIISLATAIIVILFSSVVSFIAGWFCKNNRKQLVDEKLSTTGIQFESNHSIPIYDDIKSNTVTEMCSEQGLVIKDNLAYASVH